MGESLTERRRVKDEFPRDVNFFSGEENKEREYRSALIDPGISLG